MAITRTIAPTLTRVSPGATIWTVPLPSGLSSGMVVILALTTATGQTPAASGLPSGIQSTRFHGQFDDGTADGQPDRDGDATTTILAYTVPASPPASLSIPMTAEAAGHIATVALTGAHATEALGAFANRNKSGGDGAAVPTPTVTPTFTNGLVIRGALLQAAGALTAPSGSNASLLSAAADAPSAGLAVMQTQTTATATGTADFTTPNTGDFGGGWTLVVKAADSQTGGTEPPVNPPADTGHTAFTSAATTWNIPMPSGATQGEVVLISVNTASDHTVSSTASGVHGTRFTSQFDPGDPKATIMTYVVPASPPATIGVTFSSAQIGQALTRRIAGLNTANPFDVFEDLDTGSSNGNLFSTPSPTTIVPGSRVVRGVIINSNTSATAPSGATSSAATASGSSPVALMAVMGEQANPGSVGFVDVPYSGVLAYGSAWTLALRKAGANAAPVVSAGPDQTVEPWSTVTLAATATDLDGSIASITWTQISGPNTPLSGSGAPRTLVAPALMNGATLTYRITVVDNSNATSTDEVTITVLPATEFHRLGGVWVPVRPILV